LQYIAQFTQRCVETGVIGDFDFISEEHPLPSDIDLTNPIDAAAWGTDPRRITKGNLLIDASSTTIDKMQAARDHITSSLEQFTAPPDPIKSPVNASYLVSFQNRQWIYVLLQNTWSSNMKLIMQRYQELHEEDGVLLYFLFLQHFAGTTTENLIEAYSQLQDSKVQLTLYQGNVLNFTNALRIPVRRLLKAKEPPSIQHFISVFQGCMNAPNEEFRNFIFTLYADFRNNGPTKSLSMLQLLDKLDLEYTRINNLGCWIKKEDPQVLALTATISNLKSELSSIKHQYGSLHALLAKSTSATPLQASPPLPTQTKLQKLPPKQPTDPDIVTFQNIIWKWCDKCFGSSWNRTHITSEHVPGIGKRNRRRQATTNNNDENNNNANNNSPQAHLAQAPPVDNTTVSDSSSTNQANIAAASSSLDFI
jgi:hypothetical protein